MQTWCDQLDKTRGSRPRCVLLVDGDRQAVATRLTDLVNDPLVEVSSQDIWMPRGKPLREANSWDTSPADECRLDRDRGFVPLEDRNRLRDWWLAVERGANTPNWDLASTCRVEGKRGLLLVEAKAAYGRVVRWWYRSDEQAQPQEYRGGHPGGQRCAGQHYRGHLGFVERPPLPARKSIRVVLEARFAADSGRPRVSWISARRRDAGGGQPPFLQSGGMDRRTQDACPWRRR